VSVSDEEALDLPVLVRACPDDDDVGDGAVADPALCPVEHPTPGLAASGRLERDRVGAVGGLGERESSDRVEAGHGGQPALLLLLAAEQVDRLHREPRLDAEERAEAAVAAVKLHVDEAARERAHARAAVAGDVLAVEPEVREAAQELPGQLRGLPVLVDRRQHLIVDEAPCGREPIPLLVGELLADLEVVRGERLAEVGIGQGRGRHRAPFSPRGRTCPAPSPRP
jgi:hypothetical protein